MQAPGAIRLHTQSQELELAWGEQSYRLSSELLRVLSPSAEVRGHGRPVLQTGKRFVAIRNLAPAGNYGIKIHFDDGHDTGIYTWDYLHQLCTQKDALWADYLQQLEAAGARREPELIGSWRPE
ncbi:MAG: DUF971 domain-containing protein [Pseudomonadota bacterium]|nr:1-(5-phosphoribosyl)-5-((5-phosphoribosylamino)methylideneamino)imidazole-4-carboxamide isomerase [Pseudomonadales bacterium]MDY6921533.1 DUF971 domain-containing protein [Pseudomonadota bacterium]